MAIRIIRTTGDPVLREKAKEVPEITPQVKKLLEDMVETMYDAEGIGLAAPQVGISKRIIVIDVQDETGVLKLINPEIISGEGKETSVEGCLSFPGVAGEVERDESVTVRAQDPDGNTVEICASGLLARAFQHEIDHLDGILFVDKVTRLLEQKE
ncbi:peptide deformylase [Dethiobacter alkaliphilus]|uniref:Peptide deformylase n=1 Tax=Dethiobacter alkaliphilus AHT 1 TaxID=555088 RepID=C0GIQ0_DETAL|nr:peptide deformylase [Dethiobacter alkaliphilus]EEG76714.1 peptide deformylase [Dethiobacter alkaliphilus AHT 1]MCW3490900.1 peptide deformylase [Dethiobacter alkaliphilus]